MKTLLVLAACILGIGVGSYLESQIKAPPFTSCVNGGLLYQMPITTSTARPWKANEALRCVDPAVLKTPGFTGVPMTPPTTGGINLYAKLPDGSGLPMVVVPAAGLIADKIDTYFLDNQGGLTYQQVYLHLHAVNGAAALAALKQGQIDGLKAK